MRLILSFFILIICLPAFTPDQQNVYRQAGDFYKNKQFFDAKVMYEKLLDENCESPQLFYNYANACFQLYRENQDSGEANGLLGTSILFYERAHHLSPEDQDIIHNRDFAYNFTIDRYTQDKLENPLIKAVLFFFFYLDSPVQTMLAAGFFLLASICLSLFFILSGPVRVRLLKTAVPFFAVYLVLVISSAVKYKQSFPDNEAVIMSSSVDIKNEPLWESSTAFQLHEGTKVFIQKSSDNWLFIYVKSGYNGWIENHHLENI